MIKDLLTLKNLEIIISKINQNGELDDFEKYIIKQDFKKYVFFIGGNQISGSLSPFMHIYSGYKNSFPLFYSLKDISKEDSSFLRTFLDQIQKNKNFLGANITMPYKKEVYDIIKRDGVLDKSALIVGAINTLSKEKGKLKGYNSDIDGIILPIQKKLGKATTSIQTGYVFGAGGAAMASVAGLLLLGIKNIIIFNRTQDRAEKLKQHFYSEEVIKILKKNGIEEYKIDLFHYDVEDDKINKIRDLVDVPGIFINTLPFGFKDNIPKLPILEDELELIKEKIELFYDVVYDMNYENTPIISLLNGKNIPTINGKEMVVYQAGKGFGLWAKKLFNEEEILKILN